jgi:hypothetical protein
LEDLLQGSVVDTDSFNPDSDIEPDPAFYVNPHTIRFRILILIQGFDDQIEKNAAEIFFVFFIDQKLQFTIP